MLLPGTLSTALYLLGGHKLENTRRVFCVPVGKRFLCSGLLFAQVKRAECLQVCDTGLDCCVMGTTLCKIPGGRRQARDRKGGLEKVPDSVFGHSQMMCSRQERLFLGERSVEQREVNMCCVGGIWERLSTPGPTDVRWITDH